MNKTSPAVCLITGAGRRIGTQVAKTMHENGFNLVLHYHQSDQEVKQLVTDFNHIRPDSAHAIKADMRDLEAIKSLAETTYQQWQRLDILINNAAVFYPTTITTCTEAHWNEIMDINLKAPLFLIQALTAALRNHHGCIINMLDIHGERPLKEHPIYCASKAGLAMLTRSLARELAPDIRCNGIAPGAILWPDNGNDDQKNEEQKKEIISRTPLKRSGTPTDIAKAVLFLTKDANYMTGQTITIDGGRTLSN